MLLFVLCYIVSAFTIRNYDGTGNNPINSTWGCVNAALLNPFKLQPIDNLPLASDVSDLVFDYFPTETESQFSSFFVHWSQFILYDMVDIGNSAIPPSIDITINSQNTTNAVNKQTAYLDASIIYGINVFDSSKLRTYQKGLLITDENGLPPFEGNKILAADMRINENPILASIYILFYKEHNRKAKEIFAKNGDLIDETLFQLSRNWVTALIQHFTYNSYLAFLGKKVETRPYQANANAGVSTFFASITANFYHTMRPGVLFYEATEFFVLRDTLNHASILKTRDFGKILLGSTMQEAESYDPFFVKDLTHHYGYDLPGSQLNQSRLLNVPPFNSMKTQFNFTTLRSFDDLNVTNDVKTALRNMYGNDISRLESFVGILADTQNVTLPSIIVESLVEQLRRAALGDRYFYTSSGVLSPEDLAAVRSMSFRNLIQLNTNIETFPLEPFKKSTAEPTNLSGVESGQFLLKSIKLEEILVEFNVSVATQQAQITVHCEFEGWVGIGFGGEKMNLMDVITMTRENGKLVVLDQYAQLNQLSTDLSLGGTSNLIAFSDLTGSTEYKQSFQFTRNLKNSESYDVAIPLDYPIRISYAFSDSSYQIAYHGANRGSTLLTLKTNSENQTNIDTSSTSTYLIENLLHVLLMVIFFGIFVPLGLFLARHATGENGWIRKHKEMMMIGLSEGANGHMGLVTFLLMITIVMLGQLHYSKFALKHLSVTLLTRTHKVLGILAVLLGVATGFRGVMQLFSTSHNFMIAASIYWAWTGLVLLIFFAAERPHILARLVTPKKSLQKIAEFSWAHVQERVKIGSMWLVIKGRVYDVHEFMDHHPGGASVIQSVVGTDATSWFYGTNDKGGSVVHRHSKFAESELQQLLVGKILDLSKTRSFKVSVDSKSNANQFRSMTIRKKELVVGLNATAPVYQFQIALPDSSEKVDLQPGSHIQIQAIVNDKAVNRTYTITRLKTNGILFAVIKVYTNGMLTSCLDKSKVGEHLRVKGAIEPGEPNDLLNNSDPKGVWQNLLMISAGTGLTPMLGLIEHHLAAYRETHNPMKMTLLTSYAVEEDIILRNYLDILAHQNSDVFNLAVTLTKPPPNDSWDSPNHFRGRISNHILTKVIPFHHTLANRYCDEQGKQRFRKTISSPVSENKTLLLHAGSEEFQFSLPKVPESYRIVICGTPEFKQHVVDLLLEMNFSWQLIHSI